MLFAKLNQASLLAKLAFNAARYLRNYSTFCSKATLQNCNHAAIPLDLLTITIAIGLLVLPIESNARAQSTPGATKKIALLVGIDDYKDKNLTDLQFAENDVTVVAQQLKKLGFETTVLTGRNATQADIERELDAFIKIASDLESDDIVLAMFSGHGQELDSIVEKKQSIGDQQNTVKRLETIPYFCARDAIPFDKTTHLLGGQTESQIADEFKLISLNRLIGRLAKKSNSERNLLIVDACRNDPSKGLGRTANISGNTVKELPTGMSILFAAKSGQKSWESSDPHIKHGVMTHFLIQGLQGKAVDSNGEYTWGDLANYVRKSVIHNKGKLAGGRSRIQNPHRMDNSSDIIVLGSSPKALLLVAPFGKREIESAIQSVETTHKMKPVIKNEIGMEFCLIPAGTFVMGSPKSEQKRDSDEHEHLVSISRPFYMGSFEVTQSQWQHVMGRNPSYFSSSGEGAADVQSLDTSDLPVENVSWTDAKEFIKRLNSDFEVPAYRYRLPTEAEWEYACRAGTQSEFYFAAANQLEHYGWFKENAFDLRRRTSQVGQKKPNQFGLHDMHGNVAEWCSDFYHKNYYQHSEEVDPKGPNIGTKRILRGGSWATAASGCRSANRIKPLGKGDATVGLRVVISETEYSN